MFLIKRFFFKQLYLQTINYYVGDLDIFCDFKIIIIIFFTLNWIKSAVINNKLWKTHDNSITYKM